MTRNSASLAVMFAVLEICMHAPPPARGQCLEGHVFASDGEAVDVFGYSVAISGDTAVIGAYGDDTPGEFGAGSAYVFVRSSGVWTERAHLFASHGRTGDRLGYSVAISGDTVVVGAYSNDPPAGMDAGSAYIFSKPPGGWTSMTETAQLTASDGASDDYFGWSVAISGDTAVIGAYGDDTPGEFGDGSAYVFVRSSGVWAEQAHLFASDGAGADYFGQSVSIDGDKIVVGAYGDDTPAGSNAGSAYVFVRSGVVWTQEYHLLASDGAVGDNFGLSAVIAGDTVVVGAPRDDTVRGGDAGSTYAFNLGYCRTGDLNCDGLVNNFDINPLVLALTDPAAYQVVFPNCNILSADINGDGLVNNFDIDPFVMLLSGG